MAELILVAGATGGVGTHVVRILMALGRPVRILARDEAKARKLFTGAERPTALEIAIGDVRRPETLAAAMQGVTHVVCATGSGTPIGGNAPQHVDFEGVRNLTEAATAAGVERFVLVSSIAVTKPNHPLNAFGKVLTWKLRGEDALRASGLPYAIVRPGGLTDAPGRQKALKFDQGDRISGMISREDVAEVCVRALARPDVDNVTFEAINADGPAPNAAAWDALFGALHPDAA
jgi:uncharacterized protein YbjT (DUF2867 family)